MLDPLQIARIEACARDNPIIVALSGGGDSTALLYILREAFGPERLRVCVVDHALRPGSAADAALAWERAIALGVAAEVYTLAWPDGPKSSQAAARAERYRALCATARKYNSTLIAVGHNADDQAETVLMRAESGSSWRGLAGMREIAPAPVWPEGRGISLARPLLNYRRADLRAFLTKKGAQWIEDPANANPDFARVRMRAKLAEMEREGFDPMRLCADAQTYQRRAAELDRAAAALIAAACEIAGGRARIDPTIWSGEPAEIQMRALAVLIAAVAGSEREPDANAIERLSGDLNDPDFRGASLGGAVVQPSAGAILIRRDSGAVLGRADGRGPLPPLTLPLGQPMLWDDRLELTAQESGWRLVLGRKGDPLLERAGATITLAEAETIGQVRHLWLAEAQIQHLLQAKVGAFTPS